MKISIITLFMASLFFFSCCSTKKEVSERAKTELNNQQKNANVDKMIKQGFKSGTIIASKESECPFVINIDDSNSTRFLDPINLENSYKIDQQKIWLKFRALRMKNRCSKANPIEIEEIKKRD